jgi:hypothetical protein
MKYYFLYKVIHLPTNRYYLGKHVAKKINDGYMGSGTIWKRILNAHPKEEFERVILNFYNSNTELSEAEKLLITEETLADVKCMNLVSGGQGGGGPASALTTETRKQNGIKAALKLKGRTKETHQYIADSAIKKSLRFKAMSKDELIEVSRKTTAWMADIEKHKIACEKTALKLIGRTKENDAGRKVQAEKLSIIMQAGLAEHIAEQLRGRTKENHAGRKSQAEKISGINNPSKRIDVRNKLSKALSGQNNPSFGKYGELSAVSKLSDAERLEIISKFESGSSRKQLYAKYSHKVKAVTVKKIIANRDQIKLRLGK